VKLLKQLDKNIRPLKNKSLALHLIRFKLTVNYRRRHLSSAIKEQSKLPSCTTMSNISATVIATLSWQITRAGAPRGPNRSDRTISRNESRLSRLLQETCECEVRPSGLRWKCDDGKLWWDAIGKYLQWKCSSWCRTVTICCYVLCLLEIDTIT
jgi:hypothetical protein